MCTLGFYCAIGFITLNVHMRYSPCEFICSIVPTKGSDTELGHASVKATPQSCDRTTRLCSAQSKHQHACMHTGMPKRRKQKSPKSLGPKKGGHPDSNPHSSAGDPCCRWPRTRNIATTPSLQLWVTTAFPACMTPAKIGKILEQNCQCAHTSHKTYIQTDKQTNRDEQTDIQTDIQTRIHTYAKLRPSRHMRPRHTMSGGTIAVAWHARRKRFAPMPARRQEVLTSDPACAPARSSPALATHSKPYFRIRFSPRRELAAS